MRWPTHWIQQTHSCNQSPDLVEHTLTETHNMTASGVISFLKLDMKQQLGEEISRGMYLTVLLILHVLLFLFWATRPNWTPSQKLQLDQRSKFFFQTVSAPTQTGKAFHTWSTLWHAVGQGVLWRCLKLASYPLTPRILGGKGAKVGLHESDPWALDPHGN